jgi:hypothetical protein
VVDVAVVVADVAVVVADVAVVVAGGSDSAFITDVAVVVTGWSVDAVASLLLDDLVLFKKFAIKATCLA